MEVVKNVTMVEWKSGHGRLLLLFFFFVFFLLLLLLLATRYPPPSPPPRPTLSLRIREGTAPPISGRYGEALRK